MATELQGGLIRFPHARIDIPQREHLGRPKRRPRRQGMSTRARPEDDVFDIKAGTEGGLVVALTLNRDQVRELHAQLGEFLRSPQSTLQWD